MNYEIVTIPFGKNATLRIRKDKIIGTITNGNKTTIVTEGNLDYLDICDTPEERIINDIWGIDE